MTCFAQICRKPKVIRHITAQESEESDDLPEVRLEPDPVDENILEDEEDQLVPLEENGEDAEEGTNGEVADDETSEVIEGEGNEEEEEEEEVTLVNGDGVKITTDEKGNEVLPDGKEICIKTFFFKILTCHFSIWLA